MLVTDFSKAFNKVGHERLHHKLVYYGVRRRTLSWIRALLASTSQEVVVEGHHSDKASVLSGVLQGSFLGPCLFLYYMNDLLEGRKSNICLFADDTRVDLTLTSIVDAQNIQ